MDLFEGTFISAPCPKCGYAMDVELVSVQLQESIFCPCCKATVRLIDADASFHAAQVDIESTLRDFSRQLKKLQ